MMGLVLRRAFAAWSKVATTHAYQPEKHYMRGPGPKTLGMIGRRFRAETNKEIAEALPERWLTLMRALDHQQRQRSGTADAPTRPHQRQDAGKA